MRCCEPTDDKPMKRDRAWQACGANVRDSYDEGAETAPHCVQQKPAQAKSNYKMPLAVRG
jgi:hypothetical protein